jgi:hypothetical protein
LLRSAKEAGLSVEGVLPSMLCPCPFHGADTADYSMYWQLSQIWSWDNSAVGPFGLFLAIGLYGEILVHRLKVQWIAFTRRIHRGVLDVGVDYEPGRQTIFRGSLGRDGNVCSMPFRCGSTTHTFQLCGRHPIYARSTRILSDGDGHLRASAWNPDAVLSLQCCGSCLVRVRASCLNA